MSYLELMQMTRLGSSMIPGLLAKSWYVTMCSINFSGLKTATWHMVSHHQENLNSCMYPYTLQTQSTDSLSLTFSDMAGVPLLSTEGHADIHVVGCGVWQVLSTAVHGPAANWLRGLAAWAGALLCPLLRRSLCLTAGTRDTLLFVMIVIGIILWYDRNVFLIYNAYVRFFTCVLCLVLFMLHDEMSIYNREQVLYVCIDKKRQLIVFKIKITACSLGFCCWHHRFICKC